MSIHWYALRSKPRKEDVVWRLLKTQGYDVFYPRLRVQPVNPRSRKVRPYFPGYMFINVDVEQVGLSTFKWMPHALGLVSFGDEPAIVPENLIYAIQKRVEEIAAAGGELFDGLKQGDQIFISDGPFAGYEAIFDVRLPGSERVRVLLHLLNSQRQVPVELDAGQIQRMKKR
jgi:transcription elongation factor/antiterminator RfaH